MEAGATQPPAPSRRGGGGGGVGSPAAAAAAETGPGNSSSLRAAGTGCGLGGVNGPQLSPGTDSADENSDDDGDADISAYGDEDSGGPSLGCGGCGPPEPLKGDGERPSCRADLAWQPFHEREADLAGELSRKLSRVQAIAKKHPLKTWEREWCVASHNFLMLFASRTNHVVRKCVLMSAVRSVEPSRDGRSFRVAVDSREGVREAPEMLVLRVPRGRNAAGGDEARAQEVRRWVEEVKRRADAAVDSGNRLVPCMPLSEARRLAELFRRELDEVAQGEARQSKERVRAVRHRTLVGALHALFKAKARTHMRYAFDELVLHARLQALRGTRRAAGARRLARAAARPAGRRVGHAFTQWADSVSADMQAAREVFLMEFERSRRKAIHLGVLVLAGLERERGRAAAHCALLQLARHAECERRLEDRARAERGQCWSPPSPEWCSPGLELADPAAVVAQRLQVGAHLLRVTLRDLRTSHREWALRTWSVAAARATQAETQELIRSTAELNQQLADHCQKVHLESIVGGMVLSVRAAQRRRALFAFAALQVVAVGARRMSNDICYEKGSALPCFGVTPPPPKLQGALSFSPLPRSPFTESTVDASAA